jgi:hypothetical protein
MVKRKVKTMTDRINYIEKLERIMEQLAESVLELSDEALLAEIIESGTDPQGEAERIRLVLRQAMIPQEVEYRRQSNLGYTAISNSSDEVDRKLLVNTQPTAQKR